MLAKRFFALILVSGVSAHGLVALGQPDKLPALGSTIFAWSSIKATTNEHGLSGRVFNSPTANLSNLECHVTTLNAGLAAHPPHHHPEEEIIIIREGTVAALIDGEWKRVGPGSVIFNSCNVTHDLRNVGDRPAVYHVISWHSSLTPAKTDHPDMIEDSKVAPPKEGVMGSVAIDWNSVVVRTNVNYLSRQFFRSLVATAELLDFHATTINPGASNHPPNRHLGEEVVVIKEGTVEAYINGEWKRVEPGSVIFNASNDLQAMRNVGQTPATYFVLGWYSHAG